MKNASHEAPERASLRDWGEAAPVVNDPQWDPLESASLSWDQKRKRVHAGEVLFHQGDEVERAYRVKSGLVKLLRYLPNGRVRIVRLQTRGGWLGLEGLLGCAHEHTAMAFDEVEVDHCSIGGLQRLQADDPQLLNGLLCHWHQNLVEADRWIAEFSTGAITVRVARLLEYLAGLDWKRSDGHMELLRVHEMADILGVTPESVSRILASFKRSDVLHRATDLPNEVYRLDIDRLQAEVANLGEEL